MPAITIQAIEERCTPVTESGCWIWNYRAGSTGYGRLHVGYRKLVEAHRASYIAHKGPVPPGLFVCHKCDTRICVNPDHLYAGTTTQNMRDRRIRARTADLGHFFRDETHCASGHPREAMRFYKKGRYCLTCNKRSRERSLAKKRAAVQP